MTGLLAFTPLSALGLAPRVRGAETSDRLPSGEDQYSLHFDDLSRARWERMTEAAAAALQQSWSYGEAMRALGAGVLRVRIRDTARGQDVALAQFIIRRWMRRPRLSLAARGPVWLATLTEVEKAEALRVLRTAPLRGEHRLSWPRLGVLAPDAGVEDPALAAAGLVRVFTGPVHAELDLRAPEDDLRAAMRVKWRNRLKAAERTGLKARVFEPRFDSYGWLLATDAAQQAQRGYAALPPIFASLYHQIAGGASVRLALAEEHGDRVAAMLFLIHGRRATYHIGWSGPRGRENGAHNLLLWRAMQSLKAGGVDAIDLGGVDTGRGAGLARFKLGAGARPVPLPGAFL